MTPSPRLTEFSHCAGCAAKLNAGTLCELVKVLPEKRPSQVLVGLETGDDAGVYQLRDDLAVVQTVDFFPPMVDDPYTFGQIAAANALSDVYAMGGRPITALNLAEFPADKLDKSVLLRILQGGCDKVMEAGATVVGGHTIRDETLKYGLAVTGVIHPKDVLTNAGARPGDRVILTKPLGIGLIMSGSRAEMAEPSAVQTALDVMTTLNKAASEVVLRVGANSCTDVTGFGLIGHAVEMAEGSGAGLVIDSASVPVIDTATMLADMGLMPEGSHANRSVFGDRVTMSKDVPQGLQDVLFDAQTSGGLLISVPRNLAERMVEELRGAGVADARVIGEATSSEAGRLVIE
ncbi:MAG: selenide, water dikinase SelD [Planctomycetes bacterium]|nr:selenide, water dikinase SelD [Planctomycetota bacterium]